MSRWIVVSNRLPFSRRADGSFHPSSGGLVTAIGGIHNVQQVERLWIGGAPEGLSEEEWQHSSAPDVNGWQFTPVFLEPGLYDLYYNGFCNDVLWPLLHYQNELVRYSDKAWHGYVQVNERFAAEIAKILKPDDLLWIHDYHFFLLPALVKKEFPKLRVGFFLHVPFPSSEVFRQLPAREAILQSLLAADLVGFHDYSYLHHFSSSLSRILGVDSSLLSARYRGHTSRLGVFPVSIDTQSLCARAKEPKVHELEKRYRRNSFLFLGVDRLDYIKGIDLKLLAFRNLLQRFPEVHGKVSLLQVAVPTRQGSPDFSRLHQETNRLVGEINGDFSRPDWIPVHYMHKSVNHQELTALYRAANALVITSKRDGMNLVALEYIVSQTADRPGVVLLSEFTGALSTLSHTLPINPWNIEDTADKMKLAMEMPKQEKSLRLEAMTRFLDRYTATDWAQSFIHDLTTTPPSTVESAPKFSLTREAIEELATMISERTPSGRVALFLDYDGTLVPIEDSPDLALLPAEVREWLREMRRYSWLDLLIFSGRDKRFLSAQLGDLDLFLGAEHGATFFDPGTHRWHRRVLQSRTTWYPAALKILSDYAARVPRSQIEKKHYSIAWHFRQSPQEHASYMARKLAEELETGLANLPVSILRGHKVIEVRSLEADKGALANWFLENHSEGAFPLAIGDDRTDEDLFCALKGRGLCFRIGNNETNADFQLESQRDVQPLVNRLFHRLERLFSARRAEQNLRLASATLQPGVPLTRLN